ncbi:MAG: hypothetical protein ABIK65_02335 [Candidatus Eisenbacteria bacterium]
MLRDAVRFRLLVALPVALILFSGCAAVHKPLDPALLASIDQTNMRTAVLQEEISIYVEKSTTGDVVAGGGGLCCMIIGSAIDKSVDASRSRRAEEWVAPLLEQTPDVDYRKDFWEAVLPTLHSLSWLKLGETELTAEAGQMAGVQLNTNIKKAAGDVPEEWLEDDVLLLSSRYQLTADGRRLVVTTSVQYWAEPKKKPSYYAFHSYYSPTAEAEDPEGCLAEWAAGGAVKYRAELARAIDETMIMIRHDLPLADGGTGHLAGTPAVVKAKHILGVGSTAGHILEKAGDRVVFRLQGGNLVSLPLDEIEITEKKGRS